MIVGGEKKSGQVVTAEYYRGGADAKPHLKEHLDRIRKAAGEIDGSRDVVIRVRLDGGFFSWNNVDELNGESGAEEMLNTLDREVNVRYAMKIDSQSTTLARAATLDYVPSKFKLLEQRGKRRLTGKEKRKAQFEYGEFEYQSLKRNQRDRVVVRRRKATVSKSKKKVPTLFACDADEYEYEFIVTNDTKPPEDIWRWYDQGVFIEQIIENGKNGCVWDRFDGDGFEENRVLFFMKVLGSNVLRALQRKILKGTAAVWELPTVIRRIIRIPAVLVRRGKGWVMKAFQDHPLAGLLETAQVRILRMAAAQLT